MLIVSSLNESGPDWTEESSAVTPPAGWSRVRLCSVAIAWTAMMVSSLILLGWGLGWCLQVDGSDALRPRTLACILFAGVALRQWHVDGASRTGRWLAAAIGTTGLMTVAYYATSRVIASGDALYVNGALLEIASQARLSLPSSLIVTLIGLALWCLHTDRSPRLTESASLAAGALCLIATIGHLYHADELFAPFSGRGIALAPSLMLGAVCFGILTARPDRGIVALVASDRPAGFVARGLLGPILLAPVILGALSLMGARAGFYDEQLGMAIVVVSTIGILAFLVLRLARTLTQLDRRLHDVQARLVQAHRIDAASYLAGWTCHELNNLLTPILGYTALILDQETSSVARDHALEVATAARECERLTAKLLRFSSHEFVVPELIDLSAVVTNLESTIVSIVGPAVRATLLLEPDVAVRGNRAQLEHVVVQLVLNARDAMPRGGTMAVRVDAGIGHRGGTARLIVSDSGHGMTATVRARALEPFFTTKDRGRGTGLGLATVFGIVKQLAGSIDIQSQPGEGTTVTVQLPRNGSPERGAQPGPARIAK